VEDKKPTTGEPWVFVENRLLTSTSTTGRVAYYDHNTADYM
jgi:hypothetical protein